MVGTGLSTRSATGQGQTGRIGRVGSGRCRILPQRIVAGCRIGIALPGIGSNRRCRHGTGNRAGRGSAPIDGRLLCGQGRIWWLVLVTAEPIRSGKAARTRVRLTTYRHGGNDQGGNDHYRFPCGMTCSHSRQTLIFSWTKTRGVRHRHAQQVGTAGALFPEEPTD